MTLATSTLELDVEDIDNYDSADITTFARILKDAQNRLRKKEATIIELQSEFDQQRRRWLATERSLKERADSEAQQRRALETEVESLRAQLRSAQNNFLAERTRLINQLREIGNEYIALDEEFKREKARLSVLQEQGTTVGSDSEMQRLRAELEYERTQRQQLWEEKSRLQASLEEALLQRDQLRLSFTPTHRDEMKKHIPSLDILELQRRYDAERSEWERRERELLQRAVDLERLLREARDHVDTTQTEVDAVVDRICEMAAEQERLRARQRELVAAIDAARRERDESREREQKLLAAIGDVVEKKKAVTDASGVDGEQLNDVLIRIEQTRAEALQLERMAQRYQEELEHFTASANAQIREAVELERSELESERRELLAERSRLEQIVRIRDSERDGEAKYKQFLLEDRQKLAQQVERLRAELEHRASLELETEGLREALEHMQLFRERAEHAEAECEEIRRKFDEEKHRVSELENARRAAEKEIAEMATVIEVLRMQLNEIAQHGERDRRLLTLGIVNNATADTPINEVPVQAKT